jgi:hypothetical protein
MQFVESAGAHLLHNFCPFKAVAAPPNQLEAVCLLCHHRTLDRQQLRVHLHYVIGDQKVFIIRAPNIARHDIPCST